MKQQNPLYRAVGMLGALVAAIGCSGVDDNNDAGSSADALIAARGRQHRRVNPAPGNAGGSASSGAAGAASSSSAGTAANAAAASDDLGALIAAAQTPDGRAIPQAAGPKRVSAGVRRARLLVVSAARSNVRVSGARAALSLCTF